MQFFVGLFFGFYYYLLLSFITAAAFMPFWDVPDQWTTKRIKIWCAIALPLSEGCACYAASGHGTIAVLTSAITVIALFVWVAIAWKLAGSVDSGQKPQ
jgi:hypothetical protein